MDEGKFPGQTIPFGALVIFLPAPVVKRPKAAEKSLPAIFVGYHVAPGGRWRGDYLAVPLAQCRDMNIGEEGVPTPWTAVRIKEAHVSHVDPISVPLQGDIRTPA